ncbi:MAG TPA: PKD domain-containing protein [Bacteroidia bacterium]|nr:PKD domain-containing protein [Bacteroidia bacterium]
MKPNCGINVTFYRFLVLSVLMLLHVFAIAQTPVASFQVSAGQGCSPLNVQFTNTSQNAVSYFWNFGNGNTSTQQNPSNIYTQAGNYSSSLTVTSASGITSTYSYNISVVQNPIASFSISGGVTCQGYGVVQFTNLSANYDSCVWDFGDGTTSNVINPSHVYVSSGTFNTKLIVYNKQFGCSDIKIINSSVVINPQPIANITVDTLTTCDLQHSFQFNASSTNQISSWLWNFGDNSTVNQQQASHIYSSSGNYNVSLITSNNFGCYDTAYFSDSLRIKSNPDPVIVMTDTNGCTPLSINFLCYTLGSSYLWDFDNGLTSSTRNTSVIYTDSGTYSPSLTITYANGCSRTKILGPVLVEKAPIPAFSMLNYSGCIPLTVTFNNTTPPGSYTWIWDFGDGDSSTAFSPIHVYDSVGYFVASLTAISPNGCTNVQRNGWYYVSAVGPTAKFTADVTSGCNPLQVNFTNQSVGAISWLWDFGDGFTSVAQHPNHTYLTQGTFYVKLIAYNSQGCTDTFTLSTPINVSAYVSNFVPPAPIYGCVPYSVNLADASGSASVLWDFGDGTTSTSPNPYHSYDSAGTYVVSLTMWATNGGCEMKIPNFQTFVIDAANPGFTYTVDPCPPFAVHFHDTTQNVTAWSWTFGDGGSGTGQNPVHLYNSTGYYSVNLSVTTASGCITTLSATNSVHITGLGAAPSFFTADTIPAFNVQFHANSTQATWWSWNFGDGSTSTLENPTHIYTGTGPYTISLTIGNDSCQFLYNYPPVSMGSTGSGGSPIGNDSIPPPPIQYHCAPYTVNFVSPLPGTTSIVWDFGDGVTSTDLNPEHTFTDSGTFVVSAIVTHGGIVDTVFMNEWYYVTKPITDFNISTINTCTGVIVNVGSPLIANTYLWDFGGGSTSTNASASHTYPSLNASYVISLNSTDTNGCSAFVAKSFAVNVTNPISASTRRSCANDSISFNAGNINFSQYYWDFGDGNTSTLKNPYHVYGDSGIFQVSLTVVDINGCSINYPLSYLIEVFNPQAAFVFSTPTSNCSWVYTYFTNQSTNSDSWLWTFGDGSSSTSNSLYHYYSQLGYHDVTLTAYKNVCSSTITIPNAIYVPNRSADFTYVQSQNCLPVTINFQDLSVDAVAWRWDFGDGDTSDVQSPSHVYLKAPNSPITLTITDVNGCKVSISKPNIQVTDATFYPSLTHGCNPATVAFADSSINPLSWQWDFGDGTTSNLQNPVHTYIVDGFYDVQLIVESVSGCFDTLHVDTLVSVLTSTALFNADSTTGCLPFMVNFADSSLNAVSWQWDFGDGSSSTLMNPSHIYSTPGVYTVTLIATNANGCSDTLTRTNYITVNGAIPQFAVSNISGCSPLSVTFSDMSSGAVGWIWNFGDGTIDSIQNPVHLYADTGSYVVSLYAIDATGCSTIFTYPQPITTSASPNAQFVKSDSVGCSPLTVSFNSLATSADSLIWLMGDGTILYGSNPSYTYAIPGDYQITLIAKNIGGCSDTIVDPVPVHVSLSPQASFSTDIQEGCDPLQVNFVNESSGLDNPLYLWYFGNGDTSILQNPTYVYTGAGSFTPSLVVINQGGCTDSISMPDLITVYDQLPPPPTRIYRVSVVDNSSVKVNWQLCLQQDMDYYVVYRYNTSTSSFDSIASISQNTAAISGAAPEYIDYGLNTLQNSYEYKVSAVDRCGNRQPLSALKSHATMELNAVAGFMKVNLTWSPYIGCDFGGYEIYRKDVGGSFQLLTSVDTSVTLFDDTTAYCPTEFSYQIRALAICGDANFDSWSDTASATPISDIGKQVVDVTRSTVVNDLFVLTEWGTPSYRPDLVDRYNIFRSTDNVHFELIASVPETVHDYSDYNVDVDNQDYYYKIEVQNVCSAADGQSGVASSILLKAIQTEVSNSLKWTRYVDWDLGVEKYVIEKLNAYGVWEEIDTVSGSVTEWEEK